MKECFMQTFSGRRKVNCKCLVEERKQTQMFKKSDSCSLKQGESLQAAKVQAGSSLRKGEEGSFQCGALLFMCSQMQMESLYPAGPGISSEMENR
jgi:hypothetical protein